MIKETRFWVIFSIVMATAIGRILLVGSPNFSPVGAMALFAGAHFSKKLFAFLIPILGMLASDLILGYSPYLATYIAFALVVGLGILIQKRKKPLHIMGMALGSSLLFFVVTNFATWLSGTMYPMSFTGLIECYTMAIPFFGNTVSGNLIFTPILFGGFHLAQLKFPVLRLERVKR